MKCPICHGKGRIQDHKYNEEHDIEYLVYCEKKCEYCNGTGEVQMTNEEWLRSCTTEQLANVFFDYRYVNATPQQQLWLSANEDFVKGGIVEWLKQPHNSSK